VELAAAVSFIESTGASGNMAFLIAKEAGRLPPDQCRQALPPFQLLLPPSMLARLSPFTACCDCLHAVNAWNA
jgi:hypothetical protein